MKHSCYEYEVYPDIDYEKLKKAVRLVDEFAKLKDILIDFSITLNRSSLEFPQWFRIKRNDGHPHYPDSFQNLDDLIKEYTWLVSPERWND